MGFGYEDPKLWKNCDLCDIRYYYWGNSPLYCAKCSTLDPISNDDILNAVDILARTLTGKGLMVMLKVRETYFS